MHCESCVAEIKEALEETAGVQSADVTFKRKTAVVDFDERTVQQQTLLKKIQDLGYTATVSGESQSGVGA
jgi:copper chaperone CopZ